MRNNRPVAILPEGLSPLEVKGLENVCGLLGYRLVSTESTDDHAFIIRVVDSNVFLSRIDFYLPRKTSVLLFVRTGTEGSSYPCKWVNSADTTEMITTALSSFEIPEQEELQQGELTHREIEVLREIASGKTLKEVADRLCISFNTVLTHRKNISAKLGIRTVSGLSVYATMNGLI